MIRDKDFAAKHIENWKIHGEHLEFCEGQGEERGEEA